MTPTNNPLELTIITNARLRHAKFAGYSTSLYIQQLIHLLDSLSLDSVDKCVVLGADLYRVTIGTEVYALTPDSYTLVHPQ